PFADGQLLVRNFNNDFLLLYATNGGDLSALGRGIHTQKFNFIREVIVTEKEICLALHSHFKPADLTALTTIITNAPTAPRSLRLPVHFAEHEDWRAVERETQLDQNQVITQLCQRTFSVAMFGFLPGFLYLAGLPSNLHLPRKSIPAKYVEANSLAIGGRYLGLYAVPSPGGWHVLGRMPLSLLQRDTLPPSAFELGDGVQLTAISATDFTYLQRELPSILEYNE
ncbi:MAG: carboxyltransferase domain-containing protein, partial [Bacteroidota bacterium]